jgi:hypothetical protein
MTIAPPPAYGVPLGRRRSGFGGRQARFERWKGV